MSDKSSDINKHETKSQGSKLPPVPPKNISKETGPGKSGDDKIIITRKGKPIGKVNLI